ncbi:MAG: sugar phosphate isomerase/epimerase [Firmicutes bacterium]|nr:sugar phosphate isomerase/epimerase [Bacillota bacterium]
MAYKLDIGIVVKLEEKGENVIQKVHELGFKVCQISVYDTSYYTDAIASIIKEQCAKYGVTIDGIWTGWPGDLAWNFTKGPETVGLVPPHLRDERAEVIKQGSDFAAKLGVKRIITHLGFVPEDMKDQKYIDLIPVLQDIAAHCRKNNQDFLFETGQETPVTLLRTIEDIGVENVGVNLDPANLVLYGKGNPVDALDVLGRHVKGVHIKDGTYPTDGRNLGQEKPVGEGIVDFPELLAKLKKLGYSEPVCIECELEEDVRLREIENAKNALNGWLAEL